MVLLNDLHDERFVNLFVMEKLDDQQCSDKRIFCSRTEVDERATLVLEHDEKYQNDEAF